MSLSFLTSDSTTLIFCSPVKHHDERPSSPLEPLSTLSGASYIAMGAANLVAATLVAYAPYTAAKKVTVRAVFPAILYYALVAAVLSYVVGYQIVAKGGYKAFFSLEGVARATYRHASSYTPLADLAYCHADPDTPCVTWDDSLTTRASADGGLLVGTRITRRLQKRNVSCAELAYGCAPWFEDSATEVYAGDVESGTLLVQHSVTTSSPLLAHSRSSLDSFGARPAALLSGDGGSVTTTPCGVGAPASAAARCGAARGDLLTLGDLLHAAGVDLDAHSSASANESRRASGITLILTVEYNAGFGEASYAYRVNTSKLEAKGVWYGAFASTFGAGANATRELFDVHGVQIALKQTGGLFTFDAFTLLLTIVSGLALVSVSQMATEVYLLYLSPRRADYRLWLRSQTPDWSDQAAEAVDAAGRAVKDKRERRRRYSLDSKPLAALDAAGAVVGGGEGSRE